VNRLARDLELYPSTCHAILKTLVSEDLVSFAPETKTYRLGLGLVQLAAPLLDENAYVERFRPRLAQLAKAHAVSIALLKIVDDRMVLIDFALPGADIQVHHRAGSRCPVLFGATGRWYAPRSGRSRAELERDFRRLHVAVPLPFDR
jgi:DNA-binding IclR family transcriptional regulator